MEILIILGLIVGLFIILRLGVLKYLEYKRDRFIKQRLAEFEKELGSRPFNGFTFTFEEDEPCVCDECLLSDESGKPATLGKSIIEKAKKQRKQKSKKVAKKVAKNKGKKRLTKNK